MDDGSDVAELMKYFKTADPNDMRFGALSERVRFLKTKKGGYEEMNDFVETMMQFGMEEGIEKGKAEMVLDTIKDLGEVSDNIKNRVLTETDTGLLKKWNKLAARADSMAEFEKAFALYM